MKNDVLEYLKTLSDNQKIQELLIKIIGKILLKQNNIKQYIKENEDKIIHIRDWIFSIVENNEAWKAPRVLTIDALNNTANKYFEKQNSKIKKIDLDETHEKLVADLGDYYVVQMLTPQALDNESKRMQHCIGYGRYDQNLKNLEYRYLSLRDKYNKAHVTLEVCNFHIKQLQGKQNKTPNIKYLDKLLPWLINNDYKVELNKYGLVFNKKDNKIYSIYNLPNNCEIDDNFHYTCFEKLPDNLTINGDLDIIEVIYRHNKIIELPKNLVVRGNLKIEIHKIQFIPSDIKIFGEIIFIDFFSFKGNIRFKIENIPKEIIYEDKISILDIIKWYNDKYKHKQINLEKNGFVLNKKDNKIYYKNYLPDNCEIDGNIFYEKIHNNIKLPNNLTINGNLFFNNFKIDVFPNNLTVNGNVFFKQTNINIVGNNLFVKGDISFTNTFINKIMKDIRVEGNIIYNSSKCNICEYSV